MNGRRNTRTRHWFFAVVACLPWLTTPASAQPQSGTCFPACRPGFTCSAQGECVEPGAVPAPTRPAPPPSPAPPAPTPARVAPGAIAACLAANESAANLERDHKLRAARAQLLLCAASTCPADVRNECTRRVSSTSNAVPTVVFEVKDASGDETTSVKVSMDGEVLADHLDGAGLELDPGEHSFTFEIAGQTPLHKQLVIHEGDKGRHELVSFAPAIPTDKTTETADSAADSTKRSGSTKRTVGFVVGGAGLVALGIATYYQVTALGRASDSDTAAGSSDPGVQATAGPIHDQASQAQTDAIIFGVVGAAALGTGLVLVLTGSSPHAPATAAGWHLVPQLGLRGGGLAAVAAW